MDAETQHRAASRQLIIAIIITAIVDGIILLGGFLTHIYLADRNQTELADIVFIGFFFLGFFAMIPAILIAQKVSRLETLFWQEIAKRFGSTYTRHPYFEKVSLVFQQGSKRKTGHGFSGTLLDRPFRFFQYQYTIGSGKHKHTYHYCVAEIFFSGSFPHIYLNNTKNRGLADIKALFLPRVALPAAMEDQFNLHVPKQYEVEALQVFTPDVLAYIHDSTWEYDLEFVEQKMYVFFEQPVKSMQTIDEMVARIKALVERLAPTLNRMQLEQIGDMKTSL